MSEAMPLSRRGLLGGAGALAAAAGATKAQAAPATPPTRRTFVLVHGAWHGGWVWRKVADRLEARGHRVLAPTLTGLADRSHLLSASVNLDMHIADIVNLFAWDDLDEVVLVAHSYGGWPVSGAMERIAPKVKTLVYLDAFFPKDGEKGTDASTPQMNAAMQAALARGEVARPVPPMSFLRIRNPEDAAWVKAKMTPQPIGVALQPIHLTGARETVRDKVYIRASDSPSPYFDRYFAEAKAKPGWTTYTVDSGHEVMVDAPDRLTEILLRHA